MKKSFFILLIGLISVISPISSYSQKKVKKSDKAKVTAVADTFKIVKPTLKDGGDSIAYVFGAMQSNGLLQYLQKELHVDLAYTRDFCKGLLDRVALDSLDKKAVAYQAGLTIGNQIESICKNLTKDYYEAEPEKSIDAKIVGNSIAACLVDANEYKTQDASGIFNKMLETKKAQNIETMYGANRIAGEKWLEENKKKEGVITMPSGMQYKVITQGTGEIAAVNDKVTVNYEGHLIDGTVFDSSLKRTKPSTFQPNQVIKGWTEALTMMPVGSKWELYLPYNLAYGINNTGDIKPYSTLIFMVEVLSVEKATPKPAAANTTKEAKSSAVTKKTSK